jgi:putative hydrolase of HD superfamily
MGERVDRLLDFLKEIEKFKKIEREIHYSDVDRKENDAEHAWHVAMFILLFEKDLPKGLDLTKMLKLALMHDLVEIGAGDTFAYDPAGRETKEEREMKAAKELFSKLPEDLEKEFMQLFLEYNQAQTREAKVVKSFDKIQPILQNLCSGGKTWKIHKLTYKQIDDYKRKHMLHDELILKVYNKVLQEAKDKNLIK